MNEKEKETVEELRKQLRLAINIDDVTTTIRNDDAETILNLIEKLQKENEEKTTIILAGAEKVKQVEKENKKLKNFTSSIFNGDIEKIIFQFKK